MRFDFSSKEYETIKELCPFTDEELKILPYKRRGFSNVHISLETDIPLRTGERRVHSIKRKISKELDNL